MQPGVPHEDTNAVLLEASGHQNYEPNKPLYFINCSISGILLYQHKSLSRITHWYCQPFRVLSRLPDTLSLDKEPSVATERTKLPHFWKALWIQLYYVEWGKDVSSRHDIVIHIPLLLFIFAWVCVSLEAALNHYWNKVERKIIIYNYKWGIHRMILLIAFLAIFIFGILRIIKGLDLNWWQWRVSLELYKQ